MAQNQQKKEAKEAAEAGTAPDGHGGVGFSDGALGEQLGLSVASNGGEHSAVVHHGSLSVSKPHGVLSHSHVGLLSNNRPSVRGIMWNPEVIPHNNTDGVHMGEKPAASVKVASGGDDDADSDEDERHDAKGKQSHGLDGRKPSITQKLTGAVVPRFKRVRCSFDTGRNGCSTRRRSLLASLALTLSRAALLRVCSI